MIITINATIKKSSVLRFLGYKDIKKVPEAVLTKVNGVLKGVPNIYGKIIYDELEFNVDKKNEIILFANGNSFYGDRIFKELSTCEFLVMAISTLGIDFGKTYREIAKDGTIYEMIIDAVGTAAISDVNQKFYLKLKGEYENKGYSLAVCVSPGDKNWDLCNQKTIFNILNGDEVGVKLNEKYVMIPEKSLTAIYGVKENKCSPLREDSCERCALTTCSFRKESQKHILSVSFCGQKKNIIADHGDNLFTVLTENNIYVPNSCGGNNTCGKCLVKIDSALTIPRSDKEDKLLKRIGASNTLRLACFISVDRDMCITLPEDNEIAQIIITGTNKEYGFEPRVRKGVVEALSDCKEKDYLNCFLNMPNISQHKIAHSVVKRLPELKHDKILAFSYISVENEIVDVDEGYEDGVYGIAVDIGTTTIVAYLVNLINGKEIDVYACLNPQKRHGADVISRINYTSQNDNGLNNMQELIINVFNNMIDSLCHRNSINRENIFEIVLVGNTTMLHFATGVSCRYIATFPFRPTFTSGLKIKSKDLNIMINPEGYVLTLPCVSSYVGADTMAAILASGIHQDEGTSLLIDIGTNGEIVLGHKDRMICCSTAAGPAFEGGKITFGVGGVQGAIDHINLADDPPYSTIGSETPIGICGSGITDAVAELLKYKIVDKTGRMKKRGEMDAQILKDILLDRMITYEGLSAFVLDEATGILITQRDIRELQLAKAAIFAGVQVLIGEMGIEPGEIDRIYLAGGFGNYLDLESAFSIMLLAQEFKGKVVPIGNGAGIGAKIALSSKESLHSLNGVATKMEYIELSTSQEFQERFIKAIHFN